MAATVTLIDGGAGDAANTEERSYLVQGATDAADARAAIIADTTNCPDAILDLQREPVHVVADGKYFKGTVRWSKKGGPGGAATGAIAKLVSWDTTGGTAKKTQSLTTVSRTGVGGATAPDCKGAIGVDDDGTVNGVEIPSPVFKFTAELVKDKATVTPTYMSNLYALIGKTNSETVKIDVYGSLWTFTECELRFMGSAGTQTDTGKVKITLHFEASPSGNVTIAGVTVAKRGFEYLWVKYAKSTDASQLTQKPIGIYVEKVHESGNFNVI